MVEKAWQLVSLHLQPSDPLLPARLHLKAPPKVRTKSSSTCTHWEHFTFKSLPAKVPRQSPDRAEKGTEASRAVSIVRTLQMCLGEICKDELTSLKLQTKESDRCESSEEKPPCGDVMWVMEGTERDCRTSMFHARQAFFLSPRSRELLGGKNSSGMTCQPQIQTQTLQ